MCSEFGNQSTLPQHLRGSIAMCRRIDIVQSVRQHSQCLVSAGKRLTVRTDVHAVCQAAHNEHLRAHFMQVGNELPDKVLTVNGAMPCSYDGDDATLIEVCRTSIKQNDGGVAAMAQPFRIGFIIESQWRDAMRLVEADFLFGGAHGIRQVLKSLHQSRSGVRNDVNNVVAMVVYGFRRPKRVVESEKVSRIGTSYTRQSNCAKGLFCNVHYYLFSMYIAL